MALDAYVACLDVIHASWIQNVSPHRVFDVGTARPVAFLTPDIPFRDLLRVYVVIHRMATVASWTRGPLHVVRGIKWFPPIGSFGYKIRTPNVICDVPLGWLGEVVVAKLSEVTLLPNASVDKCHLVFRELRNGIGREVRNDGVLTLAGVPDYVRHWRLLPVFVNLSMTTFARLRSHEVCRTIRCLLVPQLVRCQLAKTAYKQNKLPTIVALFIVGASPTRHSSESDAVANDVPDFAIREFLRFGYLQVRDFRVKIAANFRFSNTVRPVSYRAASNKTLPALFQVVGSRLKGIYFKAGISRDG